MNKLQRSLGGGFKDFKPGGPYDSPALAAELAKMEEKRRQDRIETYGGASPSSAGREDLGRPRAPVGGTTAEGPYAFRDLYQAQELVDSLRDKNRQLKDALRLKATTVRKLSELTRALMQNSKAYSERLQIVEGRQKNSGGR